MRENEEERAAFALDLRAGAAAADLREISGAPNREATRCTLRVSGGALTLTVEAEDGDMLNLLSSISEVGRDPYLYEEDCVQIAVALPGEVEPSDFLVINPHGGRKGTTGALRWNAIAHRHGRGWSLELEITLPPGTGSVGLSLHRFYRGARTEVHGLARNLPHPLRPSEFPVLVLTGDGDAARLATAHRRAAEAAEREVLDRQISAARARITSARASKGPAPTLALAEELARRRAGRTLESGGGFLCWNEGHYQMALLDLWELTGSRDWLDIAVNRMKGVWALRGSERGQADAMWGRLLPTWYNDTETNTVCTLVSGVILNPIARLIRAAHEDPGLADVWSVVKSWVPLCDTILTLHDIEWVEFADGGGMHLEPYMKGPRRVYPRGGSRINPVNREYFFTMPMVNMARVTGNAEYLRKAEMSARFFMNMRDVTADDCLCWEYEISRYPATGEDICHAACQVAFAELCRTEGVVVTDGDLRRMANTLAKRIFRHGDVPCDGLRGYAPGLHIGLATWSGLCRFVPEVFPKIEAVVATALCEGDRHFTGEQGWGVRILTCLERGRRASAAASREER